MDAAKPTSDVPGRVGPLNPSRIAMARRRQWCRPGAAALVTALWAAALAAEAAAAAAAADGECLSLSAPPRKNVQPLVFCNWYSSRSCCLPAHDADIQGKFQALIDAGDACAKFQNQAKRFLSFAFCLACDPREPEFLSSPANTRFFDADQPTAKICASVAARMAPALFGDCGLTVPDDRESVCSPNSPVVPAVEWPDCLDGQFVCQDAASMAWSCSPDPCGAANTPAGFLDAPCNASEHTCDGTLMFLNDNRAAKPPGMEDYAVEIVDERACVEENAATNTTDRCACLRDPTSAAAIHRGRLAWSWRLLLVLLSQLALSLYSSHDSPSVAGRSG